MRFNKIKICKGYCYLNGFCANLMKFRGTFYQYKFDKDLGFRITVKYLR